MGLLDVVSIIISTSAIAISIQTFKDSKKYAEVVESARERCLQKAEFEPKHLVYEHMEYDANGDIIELYQFYSDCAEVQR